MNLRGGDTGRVGQLEEQDSMSQAASSIHQSRDGSLTNPSCIPSSPPPKHRATLALRPGVPATSTSSQPFSVFRPHPTSPHSGTADCSCPCERLLHHKTSWPSSDVRLLTLQPLDAYTCLLSMVNRLALMLSTDPPLPLSVTKMSIFRWLDKRNHQVHEAG